MFKRGNMKLLVVNKNHHNEQNRQEEANSLEDLLRNVMLNEKVSYCLEVADLNRYRFLSGSSKVLPYLKSAQPEKPFVFLLNLN